MKNLFLFRGVPGSGKTTAANALCETVVSADDYFTDEDGNYEYIADEIGDAHDYCKKAVADLMKTGVDVAVANTFTREWEMDFYVEAAAHCGYKLFSFVVENRHGNESVHDVPARTVQHMTNRFEVLL